MISQDLADYGNQLTATDPSAGITKLHKLVSHAISCPCNYLKLGL